MTKIKKREEITNSIYELITNTKEILVIVSPYIKLSTDFKKALENLSKLDVIIFVFKRKDVDNETFNFLLKLPNALLYSNDYLHTKCYMNEKTAIITSLNFYKYSMENNFELAVEFDIVNENDNYQEIKSEVQYITERSVCLNEIQLKYHINEGRIVHCTSCSKNIFPVNYKETAEIGIWRKEHLCQNCINKFLEFEKTNNEIEIFKRYGSHCVLCGSINDNRFASTLGQAPICITCGNKTISPINKQKIGKLNK